MGLIQNTEKGPAMHATREKEWFDNNAFWRELYPFMFAEKRFEDGVEEAKQILELVSPKGKNVLDLCCGPGRIAIPLAQEGYQVTGVDRTKFLLNKARSRAKDAKVQIEFIEQDMRDFVRPKSFHLALSFFTSFGYFDDKNEDIAVLKNIYRSLRPGGAFVVDVVSKEGLAGKFMPTTSGMLADGTRMVQCHEIIDDWTRVSNEWILIKDGKTRTFKFHLTIYSGQELRDRMELAGFQDVKIYGGVDGKPFDQKAFRLVAVGRKS